MRMERISIATWRRKQALCLRRQGWRQHDIARALDVTDGAVSQWFAAVDRGGAPALVSRLRPARPSQLTTEQRRRIPDFLWNGLHTVEFLTHLLRVVG